MRAALSTPADHARCRATFAGTSISMGSSLNYVRLFWGVGGREFLTFSYKGEGGSLVAAYVIFFNLIFNKYKFYH